MERGFVYLFINIVATIMMKGLNLAFSLNVLELSRKTAFVGEEGIYWRPAYWFLFHVMPQFFYVSWNELLSIEVLNLAGPAKMDFSTRTGITVKSRAVACLG